MRRNVSVTGEEVAVMRRILTAVLCLTILLTLCCCASKVSTDSTTSESELTPTGLSEGQIAPPQVMYNGEIYLYRYSCPGQNGAPNGFEVVGQIKLVDDLNVPVEDMCAGGVEIAFKPGQDIYASEEDDSRICVHCDEGYYLLYRSEE